MTLLVELTDQYSNQDYFQKYKSTAIKESPIVYSHQLFYFLHCYLSDGGKEVKNILVVEPTETFIRKGFEKGFKDYSYNLSDYEGVTEIEDFFPKDEYLENELLATKIQALIRGAKFIFSGSLTGKGYLCYLSLCGEILEDKIYNNEITCSLFVGGKDSRFSQKELYNVNQSEVSSLNKILKATYQQYEELSDNRENRARAKNYHEPKFIQNFSNTYYKNLDRINYENQKGKLHFYGYDDFVAKEGADYLFGQNNYFEHDLYNNVKGISKGDVALMFFNFHKHFNETKQNLLSQIIKDCKMEKHVSIHGDYAEPISFFSDEFQKISIPSEKEIQEKISGVFVSLLKRQNKYKGFQRTLYPIVKYELLSEILSRTTNLKVLSKVIAQMDRVVGKDLYKNIAFWSVFLVKYEEELEKTNKIREDLISKNKEDEVYASPMPQYQFVRRKNNNFNIIFNGQIVTLPNNNLDGLLYIHGILRSNVKDISVTELYALKNTVLGNTVEEKYEVARPYLEEDNGSFKTDGKSMQIIDQKALYQMRSKSKKQSELIANLESELKFEEELFNYYDDDSGVDGIEGRIDEKAKLQNKIELSERKIKEAKDELENIEKHIMKATNIHGRIRQSSSPKQNHYKTVSKSIDVALNTIKEYSPELFNYLSEAVTYVKGDYIYRYTQISNIDWILDEKIT